MIHLFKKSLVNNIVVFAASSGTPVTGLVHGSFTLYASKEGATPAAVTLTGLVTEIDATNMAGLYKIAIPSATFDTVGLLTLHFSGAAFDSVIMHGNVGVRDYLLDVRALSSQVGTSITSPVYDGLGNLTSGRINGFDPDADPAVDTARVSADITATYAADGTLLTFKVKEV